MISVNISVAGKGERQRAAVRVFVDCVPGLNEVRTCERQRGPVRNSFVVGCTNALVPNRCCRQLTATVSWQRRRTNPGGAVLTAAPVTYRLPLWERHGDEMLQPFCIRIQQEFDGQFTHGLVGQGRCRELWSKVYGNGVIIEGDDRQVAGNRYPCC